MKRFTLALFFSLFSVACLSQSPTNIILSYDNPSVTIDNRTYELIDVSIMDQAKIRYTEVSETGMITKGFYFRNKPDGIWEYYDSDGNLVACIKYSVGVKVWYKIYTDNLDRTIVYENGKAVEVITTKRLLAGR